MHSKPINQFKSCFICSLSQTHINMSTLPISPLTAMRIMRVMDCICFFCLLLIFCSVIMRNVACHEQWARWELAAVPMTNSLTLPTRNISSCVVLNTCLDLHGPPDGRECFWSSHCNSCTISQYCEGRKAANKGKLRNICDWPQHADLWLAKVTLTSFEPNTIVLFIILY